MPPLHILHLHSTFSLGGKEARAVRLMNAFGAHARHTILSAMPEALGARDAIDPAIDVAFPRDAPSLAGKPAIGRYRALRRYFAGFDLILSYNWGAMDGVMARRMFGGPPLVHHEDGFNADEADGLKARRNLFRRAALPGAAALVVPSKRLERIAFNVWKQPATRVRRIENGIDVARYAGAPDPVPGFEKRAGRPVIGTIAGFRAVKNLPRLVRALAATARDADLLILGEGPERQAILAEAQRCGVADRVHLPGFVADPHRHVGLFDIFALSSDSEQAPISLIEAMAAGLPAVSTDVGDVADMVAPENRPLIVARNDEAAFADRLAMLIDRPPERARIGRANRSAAAARFDESAMISAYAALYARVAGRPGALD